MFHLVEVVCVQWQEDTWLLSQRKLCSYPHPSLSSREKFLTSVGLFSPPCSILCFRLEHRGLLLLLLLLWVRPLCCGLPGMAPQIHWAKGKEIFVPLLVSGATLISSGNGNTPFLGWFKARRTKYVCM